MGFYNNLMDYHWKQKKSKWLCEEVRAKSNNDFRSTHKKGKIISGIGSKELHTLF